MPYLHLPVQSGCRSHPRRDEPQAHGRGLPRPRRPHPRRAARHRALDRLHRRLPRRDRRRVRGDARGWCSEVGFAQAYSFKYSPRPGTPAAKLGEQVPDDVKIGTAGAAAGAAGRPAGGLQRRAGSGASYRCCSRSPGRRPGQLVGRSPYLQAVHAEAPAEHIGHILPVEILACGPNSLAGVIRSV